MLCSVNGENMSDWIGKRIGNLVVKKNVEGKSNHYTKFLCLCDCGNEKIIRGDVLYQSIKRKFVISCGCRVKKRGEKRGLTTVISYYHNHCRQNNREFSLSRDEFYEICQLNCSYCGTPPSNVARLKTKTMGDRFFIYNGIDRVDNKKGYILENCVACCKQCNLMKKDMDTEEWISHIRKIIENLDAQNLRKCIIENI